MVTMGTWGNSKHTQGEGQLTSLSFPSMPSPHPLPNSLTQVIKKGSWREYQTTNFILVTKQTLP